MFEPIIIWCLKEIFPGRRPFSGPSRTEAVTMQPSLTFEPVSFNSQDPLSQSVDKSSEPPKIPSPSESSWIRWLTDSLSSTLMKNKLSVSTKIPPETFPGVFPSSVSKIVKSLGSWAMEIAEKIENIRTAIGKTDVNLTYLRLKAMA